MPEVKRTWVGRLLDVGGFEGTVSFALQGSDQDVKGVFDAVIEGHHRPIRIRGLASGQQKGSQFSVKVDVGGQDSPISIAFEGRLFDTRRSGPAVCGRYVVSARRPSALLGGVITMRDERLAKKPDELLVRSVRAEPHGQKDEPGSPRGRRAAGARRSGAGKRTGPAQRTAAASRTRRKK